MDITDTLLPDAIALSSHPEHNPMSNEQLPHLLLPAPIEIDIPERPTLGAINAGSFFSVWDDENDKPAYFLRGEGREYYDGLELIPCYRVLDGRVYFLPPELFDRHERVRPIALDMPGATPPSASESEGQT